MSRRLAVCAVCVLTTALLLAAGCSLAAIGAGALLHPLRRAEIPQPPAVCAARTFQGARVTLKGWYCAAAGNRRGTLVYLHGVADNRASSAGVVQRYVSRGFDVIAYDSRAHGQSSGDSCTYGYYEKQDLARIIDTLPPGPIVLLGTSLGAAVALQTAAMDPRIRVVVAAETFSDLRTVASERAPFFFTRGTIDRAFTIAGRDGQFPVDEVSPLRAAGRIAVPVLLIHGADDRATAPAHSQRVFDALRTRKRLILVPAAGHSQSLDSSVWGDVDRWIEDSLRKRES